MIRPITVWDVSCPFHTCQAPTMRECRMVGGVPWFHKARKDKARAQHRAANPKPTKE